MGRPPRPDLAARNRARANPSAPVHHPLHNTWKGMVARCHNPRSKDWENYGARGIVVCEAWRASFDRFVADMGPRPSVRHQIDRRNNDGPYDPDNCRWATLEQQARNRRSSRLITFNGETLNLADWSARTGIGRVLIMHRLRAGWPVADALTLRPDRSANYRKGRSVA